MNSIHNASPKMDKAMASIEAKIQNLQEELNANRLAMQAVRAANEEVQKIQDETSRRALVLGKISLYLENIPEIADTNLLKNQLDALIEERDQLEEVLSDEQIKDRLESISVILGKDMTSWAESLKLEYAMYPLRFDFKHLSVAADTDDGPIAMRQMGSGENWVGYHIIAHLGLHKWFASRTRPVPRFIFFDQPSQIYFPSADEIDASSNGERESDSVAVQRMFRLVFEIVNAIKPGLQVIITEHADIKQEYYQNAIIERWGEKLKLIPDEWPRIKGPGTQQQ